MFWQTRCTKVRYRPKNPANMRWINMSRTLYREFADTKVHIFSIRANNSRGFFTADCLRGIVCLDRVWEVDCCVARLSIERHHVGVLRSAVTVLLRDAAFSGLWHRSESLVICKQKRASPLRISPKTSRVNRHLEREPALSQNRYVSVFSQLIFGTANIIRYFVSCNIIVWFCRFFPIFAVLPLLSGLRVQG